MSPEDGLQLKTSALAWQGFQSLGRGFIVFCLFSDGQMVGYYPLDSQEFNWYAAEVEEGWLRQVVETYDPEKERVLLIYRNNEIVEGLLQGVEPGHEDLWPPNAYAIVGYQSDQKPAYVLPFRAKGQS